MRPVKIMATQRSSLLVLIVTAFALATQAVPQRSNVYTNPVLKTSTINDEDRPQVIQVAVLGNNYDNSPAQPPYVPDAKGESPSSNQVTRGHDLKPSQRLLMNAFAFGMPTDDQEPEEDSKTELKQSFDDTEKQKPGSVRIQAKPSSNDKKNSSNDKNSKKTDSVHLLQHSSNENLKDNNDEFTQHFSDQLSVWNDRFDGKNSESKENNLASGGVWQMLSLRDYLSADPRITNSRASMSYINRFQTDKSKNANKDYSYRRNRKLFL